jgi:hypothetical protein
MFRRSKKNNILIITEIMETKYLDLICDFADI